MAKAMKRQGRRVMPAIRRNTVRATAAAKQATLTLGDLIAAAFDTVGSAKAVRKVLASDELAAAIGKRIVAV